MRKKRENHRKTRFLRIFGELFSGIMKIGISNWLHNELQSTSRRPVFANRSPCVSAINRRKRELKRGPTTHYPGDLKNVVKFEGNAILRYPHPKGRHANLFCQMPQSNT